MWQRAQELALAVMQIVQQLPQNWGNAVIARQIISSATSIGANIAEGHARYTPGAHRNHLSIAKGSAAETDSWLDLLRRSGSIGSQEEAPLHQECNELIAMLTSKIRELERVEQDSSSRLREEVTDYIIPVDQPTFPFTHQDYQSRSSDDE